jgi:hypothetical protein
MPVKSLKQILIEFYTSEQICNAKETLINHMEQANLDKWVRPPKRRRDSKENPGNKSRMDVEDILSIVVFIDENNVHSKLPIYVASDPDLLPSIKLTDGDLICVMNKLSNIDQTLNTVKTEVLKSLEAGFNKSSRPNRIAVLNTSASPHQQQNQSNEAIPGPAGASAQIPAVLQLRHNATSLRNHYHPPSTSGGADDLTSDDAQDCQSDFITVTGRKKKRKFIRSPTNVSSYPQAATSQERPPGPNTVVKNNPRNQPKRKSLVGGLTSTSCTLKAANNLQIKKKAYKLGNIDAIYSSDDVTNYIVTVGVRVM